jgi:hypothetical protein
MTHALAIAQREDLPVAAMRAHYNLANWSMARDAFEEAIAELERGLAVSRRRGDRFWEGLLLSQACYPLVMLGRWDEALESGMALLARGGLTALATLPSVARIQAGRGDHAALESTLARATASLGSEASEYAPSASVAQAIALGTLGRAGGGAGDRARADDASGSLPRGPHAGDRGRHRCRVRAGRRGDDAAAGGCRRGSAAATAHTHGGGPAAPD